MAEQEELLKLVEELEREADSAELDQDVRSDLIALTERLRRRALAPQLEEPEDERVEDAVEQAVADFERSHPQLTNVLGSILHLLSSIGI